MAASGMGSALAAAFMVLIIRSNVAGAENFFSDVRVTWGQEDVWISEDGSQLQLKLVNNITGGSGFQSYGYFAYGIFSVNLKLVAGNSAGTVTTFYLTSPRNDSAGLLHDEIDMEFLGNLSGNPYVLHTNVYVAGKADKEQRFYLWFDPTSDFHNYTILWNSNHIVWIVDGIPLRVFRNYESIGVPYPKIRPMNVQASLWNADQWATQGGRIKTDWSQAPFVASYANISLSGCTDWASPNVYACWGNNYAWNTDPKLQALNYAEQGQLQWVHNNFIVYDYCQDLPRFNNQPPVECSMPKY